MFSWGGWTRERAHAGMKNGASWDPQRSCCVLRLPGALALGVGDHCALPLRAFGPSLELLCVFPSFSCHQLAVLCAFLFLFLAALGLSCHTWDLSLWSVGSVAVACRLSCSEACGILVPRPGIEPASPALEGGFLNTVPPGKSLCISYSFIYSITKCLWSAYSMPRVGIQQHQNKVPTLGR